MRKIFIGLLLTLHSIGAISQTNNEIHNGNPNTFVSFNQIEDYYEFENSKSSVKADIYYYGATFAYMLLIECAGETRTICKTKKENLNSVFKTFSLPYNVEELFENEVLVKTDCGYCWLPIQNSLFGYWNEELKNGDKALIYIRALGSTVSSKDDKWLFTINSFNSGYYDALWEESLKSFNNGDEINGISCIKKMMELNPADGRNLYMYGFYFYTKAYPDNRPLLLKADSLYSVAEKLSPKYSYGHYQKALVKFQLKRYIDAWAAIDKAKSLGETEIEDFIIEQLEDKLPYSEYLSITN